MKNLNRIIEISKKVSKSGKFELKDSADSVALAKEFGINEISANIFSYLFCKNIDDDYLYFVLYDDISLDYSNSELLLYIDNFEELLEKGYIVPRHSVPYIKDAFDLNFQFEIPFEIEDLIIHNKDIKNYKPTYNKKFKYNFVNFITSLDEVPTKIIKYSDKLIRYIQPFLKDKQMAELADDFGINIEKPGDLLDIRQFRIFCYLARGLNDSYDPRTVNHILDCFSVSNEDIIDILSEIKNKKSVAFEKGYLKIKSGSSSIDSAEITWGPKTISNFGSDIFLLKNRPDELKSLRKINNTEIKEKKLFYNPQNRNDIKRLKKILDEDNYKNLRERLTEKGFNNALTILLYGPPGTGKTETVLQLARETGRTVLQLNLEEVRSCWVGESEKNIKEVFESYNSITSKLKPILLFNEADGILSKRTSVDNGNSAVTKMENTIQNIILEQLEVFDGIFIATTNLANNFDKAFERRFLYKVELKNPDFEAKKNIFKEKLPELSNELIEKIARRYDFSGGQIDNISKKIETDYILYGDKPTEESVIDFCNKEKLYEESERPIGFNK